MSLQAHFYPTLQSWPARFNQSYKEPKVEMKLTYARNLSERTNVSQFNNLNYTHD